MNTKRLRWLTVLSLVISALLMPAVAQAVTPMPMGPDEAMVPGTWDPINMGEQHWFVFNYDGKKDPIEIHLYAKPTDGVTFRVLTPAQVQQWRDTGEIKWTGAGAYNEAEKSELFWTGEFNMAGKYYVLVEHSKVMKGTAWCKLTIEGKGVTFPGEPAMPVAGPAVRPLTPATGSGPDLAYLPGKWQELREGEKNWFAFTYDKHAIDPMIEIKFYTNHTEGVTFKILTPEQAQQWRVDGKLEWIGAGAKEEATRAELSWQGKFTTSGTYYVVVEHSKTQGETSYGKLMISGEGVTF